MNKKVKTSLIVIIVLLIIVLIITMVRKKSNNSNDGSNLVNNVKTVNLEEAKQLEKEFYSALEKTYEIYKQYGAPIEDFWIYMSIDSINSNMENGHVQGVGSEYGVDLYMVKKYDMKGTELEKFPNTYLDGSKIEFNQKYYEIKPEETYMIKLYSGSEMVFYYTIKFTEQGKASLKPVCYTIGENIPIDSLGDEPLGM